MTQLVLGVPVTATQRLGSDVERMLLADGRTVVVKAGDPTAEAAGLRWLQVPDGPPVPAVLESTDRLVVEHVETIGPTRAAAERFGGALARMHTAGATAFGAPPPGGPAAATIGHAPLRNDPAPAWPAWYATDRLLPYLRAAHDTGALADIAVVEEVCERIEELAGPPEQPARLHGDLWTGNVLWAPAGATLIDPAAHGGHRETDLAMLALFGCPHLDAVVGAYDETAPLADGWSARVPLHQLFPLLVHVVLFGGGYAGQAVAAARAALQG